MRHMVSIAKDTAGPAAIRASGEEATPPAVAAVKDALQVHAVGVPEADPNRKKSSGEVLFDRVVYTGIGFGVNEAASLWITDQFMHGKPKSWLGGKAFSKEGFEAASNWIAKTFKMPKAKAGNSLLMVTLLSGGTLLVLPMRQLEEHKLYWVKKANHFMDWVKGNKMSAEDTAARDAEVEQHIACSPQQTWKALAVGRVTAMLSSWATGTFLIGPDNNKKIMNWSERQLTGAAKAVGMEKTAKSDIFKRYAQLIGVETYSCAISSVVLEIASKMFARRGTEVHDPEICKKIHAQKEEAAAPADAQSGTNEPRAIDPEKFRTEKTIKEKATPSALAFAEKRKVEKEIGATAQLAV
ncbi:MAG: hypothetical protein K2Q01_02150 [Rickettsiales bacterium]|nr:hypothetical protein [Rickettsiales bacterium]